MQGNNGLRVWCYTRYSTDRQRNASVMDQLRNCERRMALDGLTIAVHLSDEAVSGSTDDRPDYQRLLACQLSGEFDILVVDDLSRTFRDNLEQERIIRRFEFAGIRIISVCDGYDSNSKARKAIRTVLGLRNEMQLDQLREQVHRGLTGQALKKRSAGGTPYGYRSAPIIDGDRIDGYLKELHPERSVIAREIFKRFADGESSTAIVSDFNARGILSPGAKWRRNGTTAVKQGLWRKSAINAILHNEIYIGRYIWNQTRWERDPDTRVRKCIPRPKSEWIIHEIPELAIVDASTWRRVQSRLNERQNLFGGGKGGRATYLLSGIMRCGICGGAFAIATNNPVRYACSTRRSAGNAACTNGLRVARDLAEEKILAPVVDELLSDKAIEIGVREIRRLSRESSAKNTEAIADASIARLDIEIAELDRLERDGVLSETIAGAARSRALDERQRALRDSAAKNIHKDGVFGAERLYREEVLAKRAAVTGNNVSIARDALLELLGTIRLVPTDGVLYAEYGGSVLRLAVGASGYDGSGGPHETQYRIALTADSPRGQPWKGPKRHI